jgi:transposase-like protein
MTSVVDVAPSAMATCTCLAKDRDVLLAFYAFPTEHWSHQRITNPIERTFATIRRQPPRTKGNCSRRASLAMMDKPAESVARRWRHLDGSYQPTLVTQRRIFTDGVLQNAA